MASPLESEGPPADESLEFEADSEALSATQTAAWAELEAFVESKRINPAELEGWRVEVVDRGGGTHACHFFAPDGKRYWRKKEVVSALLKAGVQQRPEQITPDRAYRAAQARYRSQKGKLPGRLGNTFVEHLGIFTARMGFFDAENLFPVNFSAKVVEIVERIGGAAVLTISIRERETETAVAPEFVVEVPKDLDGTEHFHEAVGGTPQEAWKAALPFILRDGSPLLGSEPELTPENSYKGLFSRRDVTRFLEDKVMYIVEGMPGVMEAAYRGYTFLHNRGRQIDKDMGRRPRTQRDIKQEVKHVHSTWEKRLNPARKAEFADVRAQLRREKKRQRKSQQDEEKKRRAEMRQLKDEDRKRKKEEDMLAKAERKEKERAMTEQEKEAKRAVQNAIRNIRRELKNGFKKMRSEAAQAVQQRFETDSQPQPKEFASEEQLLSGLQGGQEKSPRGLVCGLLHDADEEDNNAVASIGFADLLEACMFLRSAKTVVGLPRVPSVEELRRALAAVARGDDWDDSGSADVSHKSGSNGAEEDAEWVPERPLRSAAGSQRKEVLNESRVLLDQVMMSMTKALRTELTVALGIAVDSDSEDDRVLPVNSLTWPDIARQIILLHLHRDLGFTDANFGKALKGPEIDDASHSAAVGKALQRMENRFSDSTEFRRLLALENKREKTRNRWRAASSKLRQHPDLTESVQALLNARELHDGAKLDLVKTISVTEGGDARAPGGESEDHKGSGGGQGPEDANASDADSEDMDTDESIFSMIQEAFQDQRRPECQRRCAGVFLLLMRERCTEYFLRHPDEYDELYHETLWRPTALMPQARAFLASGVFTGGSADMLLVDAWSLEVKRMLRNAQCYYVVDQSLQLAANQFRLLFDALMADWVLPALLGESEAAFEDLEKAIDGREMEKATYAASREVYVEPPIPSFSMDRAGAPSPGCDGISVLELQRACKADSLQVAIEKLPVSAPLEGGADGSPFLVSRLWSESFAFPRSLDPSTNKNLSALLAKDAEAELLCNAASVLASGKGTADLGSNPEDLVLVLLALIRLALRSPRVSQFYQERKRRAATAEKLALRASGSASALRSASAPGSLVRQFCDQLRVLGGEESVSLFLENASLSIDEKEEEEEEVEEDDADEHQAKGRAHSPAPAEDGVNGSGSQQAGSKKPKKAKGKHAAFMNHPYLDHDQEHRQQRESALESFLAEELLIERYNVNLRFKKGSKVSATQEADAHGPAEDDAPAPAVQVLPPRMSSADSLPSALIDRLDVACEFCGMTMREVGSVLVRGLSFEESLQLALQQKQRLKALFPIVPASTINRVHRVTVRLDGKPFSSPAPSVPYLPPISDVSQGDPQLPAFGNGQDFFDLAGPVVHECCALQYLECVEASSHQISKRFRKAAAQALAMSGEGAGKGVGGLPIGSDRSDRIFWIFPGEDDRVFVSASKSRGVAQKWSVFKGAKMIRTLIEWLLPNGRREGPLREALLEIVQSLESVESSIGHVPDAAAAAAVPKDSRVGRIGMSPEAAEPGRANGEGRLEAASDAPDTIADPLARQHADSDGEGAGPADREGTLPTGKPEPRLPASGADGADPSAAGMAACRQVQLITTKGEGVEPPTEEEIDFEIFEGEVYGPSGLYTVFSGAQYCVEVLDEDALKINFELLPEMTPVVELVVFRHGQDKPFYKISAKSPDARGYFLFNTVHPKMSGKYRYLFRATFPADADSTGPIRAEKEYFMRATSARSLVGGSLALKSSLRALEVAEQDKYALNRALVGAQRPSLTPGIIQKDVESLKTGILTVAAALPRGSLDEEGHGFVESVREAWESHVLSSETVQELSEAVVILESFLQKAWIGKGSGTVSSSAAYFLRIATPGAVALRLFALDQLVRYDKLEAGGRRRGRSANQGRASEAVSDGDRRVAPPAKKKRKTRNSGFFVGDEDDDEDWDDNDYGSNVTTHQRASKMAAHSYKEWSSGSEGEALEIQDDDSGDDAPSKRRRRGRSTSPMEDSEESAANEHVEEAAQEQGQEQDDMQFEEEDVRASEVEGDFDLRNWVDRCKFAVARLGMQLIAAPFLAPVDQSIYSDYANFVDQPMDLSEVQRRLSRSWYDDYEEVFNDVRMIRDNCMKYNGADALISQHAKQLVRKFERFYREAT